MEIVEVFHGIGEERCFTVYRSVILMNSNEFTLERKGNRSGKWTR